MPVKRCAAFIHAMKREVCQPPPGRRFERARATLYRAFPSSQNAPSGTQLRSEEFTILEAHMPPPPPPPAGLTRDLVSGGNAVQERRRRQASRELVGREAQETALGPGERDQ